MTCIISQTFSLKVWQEKGNGSTNERWRKKRGGRETAERVGERGVKE